jgi:acetyl esterase
MSIVGRIYLERGEPVTVLVQWSQVPKAQLLVLPGLALKATTPRNVLIRRADGTEVVLPFRGLRKVEPRAAE